MKHIVFVLSTLFIGFLTATSASSSAELTVRIDISDQEMRVAQNDQSLYTWPVSTGREGYRTPTGTFKPIRLERMWYSTKYDNAPMPYSIFFYGGYAIHGTTDIANLGRPASHGCIRLHPDNAKKLFEMVKTIGRSNTSITLVP